MLKVNLNKKWRLIDVGRRRLTVFIQGMFQQPVCFDRYLARAGALHARFTANLISLS